MLASKVWQLRKMANEKKRKKIIAKALAKVAFDKKGEAKYSNAQAQRLANLKNVSVGRKAKNKLSSNMHLQTSTKTSIWTVKR